MCSSILFIFRKCRICDKASAVTSRTQFNVVRSCCCRLSCVNYSLFRWTWHGFGQAVNKEKSQIKYETAYCSEIQSQKPRSDKLSCLYWFRKQSAAHFFSRTTTASLIRYTLANVVKNDLTYSSNTLLGLFYVDFCCRESISSCLIILVSIFGPQITLFIQSIR